MAPTSKPRRPCPRSYTCSRVPASRGPVLGSPWLPRVLDLSIHTVRLDTALDPGESPCRSPWRDTDCCLPEGQTRRHSPTKFSEIGADIPAYLDAVLEVGAPPLVRDALGVSARARGMSQLARATGLTREGSLQGTVRGGQPGVFNGPAPRRTPAFTALTRPNRLTTVKHVEAPVDDTAVVMHMAVEGRTEAVDEAHRPEAGMCAGATAAAQMGLDDAQEDSQDGAEGLRLALPLISNGPAQPFRHRRPGFWPCSSSPSRRTASPRLSSSAISACRLSLRGESSTSCCKS
jgi:probable addiction module antidote protein